MVRKPSAVWGKVNPKGELDQDLQRGILKVLTEDKEFFGAHKKTRHWE